MDFTSLEGLERKSRISSIVSSSPLVTVRSCVQRAHKNDVYLLPKMLNEETETLHFPTLGVELTVLTPDMQSEKV